MIKMIITEAFVSKGYESAPAIKFFDVEGGSQIASFRIGNRVYDKKAENNHRWINFTVKAFGSACERVKKMKLKEGSCINIVARYDEESWEDKEKGMQRTAAVLILDDIEYAGGGQKNGQGGASGAPQQSQQGYQAPPAAQGQFPQQGYPQPPAPPQTQTVQQGYAQGQPPQQGQAPQPPAAPMPGNFTGYEGFGGDANPYY